LGGPSWNLEAPPRLAGRASRLPPQVADALIGACSAVLTPEALPRLDYEGALDDYGRRLASCVALFGDLHYSALPSVQKRYLILEKVGSVGGRAGPARRRPAGRPQECAAAQPGAARAGWAGAAPGSWQSL
jgi:hypothetical protein